MMKSKFIRSLTITCCTIPLLSFAAVFGEYEYRNGYAADLSSYGLTGIYMDSTSQGNKMLCTDTNSRLVAGSVSLTTSGYSCDVEWKGDSFANFSHYLLKGSSAIYEWTSISDNNRALQKNIILANGVTNGGVDEGHYVFHCKAIKQNGVIYYGKYIPSRNACYLTYSPDGVLSVGDWYNDYSLMVLTAK